MDAKEAIQVLNKFLCTGNVHKNLDSHSWTNSDSCELLQNTTAINYWNFKE